MSTTSTITYVGDLHTEATHTRSGVKISTDAPVDNQGKGECFSPTDLLATALGACMVTIMGIAARTHGFNIDGTKIEIQKVMATSPRRVGEVIIDLNFPSDYSPKEKKFIEAAAKECPVAQSLHPNIKQTIHFHYGK
ncbi:MAG: OsmC family protein [Bacteroidales bacterium]|nr:OsmC family protein [Bacteroidales bacterium]HPD95605.1 OsmC family protein [Tenuifilaceae bacterium]HRX31871.1 OsmC family protein [Tenuifilaceae bacterium]